MALSAVPYGRFEWKPHNKSMMFGYLTTLVATIPSWIASQITRNELDVAPVAGGAPVTRVDTQSALLRTLDASAAEAKAALETTSEEHLNTTWQLKAHGLVVLEAPRYQVIQDTINHWTHHRGQLTVYL